MVAGPYGARVKDFSRTCLGVLDVANGEAAKRRRIYLWGQARLRFAPLEPVLRPTRAKLV